MSDKGDDSGGNILLSSQSGVMTDLEAFAAHFHLNWRLDYPNVETAAGAYIEGLTSVRRVALRQDLETLLVTNAEKNGEQLRRAWFSVGVEAWPRDEDTRASLVAVLELLRAAEKR